MKYADIENTKGNWFVTFKWNYLTRFATFKDTTPRLVKLTLKYTYPGAKNFRFKKSLFG